MPKPKYIKLEPELGDVKDATKLCNACECCTVYRKHMAAIAILLEQLREQIIHLTTMI